MTDTLYFAYGSNLSIEQIKLRCPDMVALQPYTLAGWKLAFCPHGDIRQSFNTRVNGTCVHGALYRLTAKDESTMDGYEINYNKIYFSVTLDSGKVEKCMTYIAKDRETWTTPTPEYFNRIRVGYEDWKIPTDPLFDAYRKSAGDTNADIPPEILKGEPRPITIRPHKRNE